MVRGAASTPIEQAKTLHSDDHLFLSLHADQPVTVYVAYCNANRSLSIYPPSGALSLGPERDVRIPEVQDFVVDHNLGTESLFVIASTGPLARSDPQLQEIITKAMQNPEGSPCSDTLRMTTQESREAQGLPAHLGASQTPPSGTAARDVVVAQNSAPPSGRAARKLVPPEVAGSERPRGFAVESTPGTGTKVRTDEAGIVIQAFTFTHDQ